MAEATNFYEANSLLFGKERLEVADLELMYRLEMTGEEFYYRLADRVGNPEAADLLRRNGDQLLVEFIHCSYCQSYLSK